MEINYLLNRFPKEECDGEFFSCFQPVELLNNNELDRIKPGKVSSFRYCQPNPHTYFYQKLFIQKKIILLINVS